MTSFPSIHNHLHRCCYRFLGSSFPNSPPVGVGSLGAAYAHKTNDNDIEQYNCKAWQVMKELGVEANDLYTLSAGFDHSLHPDWVHFGEEGSKILADKVIELCFKDE